MPANPRVCILTESFYPVVGGGENHARLLAERLISNGVPVFVLTRRRSAGLKKSEKVGSIPVVRIPPSGVQRLGKYFMMPWAFIHLLFHRNRYDIVYVCGLRTLGVVAWAVSFLLGKKVVMRSESCGELSGGFVWDAPNPPKSKTAASMIRLMISLRNGILKKADGFIAISGDIRKEFLMCGVDKEKIKLIPNGIDTVRFSPAEEGQKASIRGKLGIPVDKIIFIYTGKLNKGKGLELLLRVWKRLAAERADLHLVLVGGGAYQFLSCERELRAFVSGENLQGSVTFTGNVENVDEYLRCSDYFVFPSENEALGVSLLEAQSCALPSIATRTGGIPDIIRDDENGGLFDVGDEKGLYDCIERFLKEPDIARQMGKRGRSVVERGFAIGKVTDEHIRVFRSLCGAESK